MQIEVVIRTADTLEDWQAHPNLRAEIKRKIAEGMARVLRTQDLIEWDAATNANGDLVVRGFLNARPGAERLIEYTVDLGQ